MIDLQVLTLHNEHVTEIYHLNFIKIKMCSILCPILIKKGQRGGQSGKSPLILPSTLLAWRFMRAHMGRQQRAVVVAANGVSGYYEGG